jgi:hypothetical protein
VGKQSFRVVISSALLAVLAACGGGGGDAGSASAAVDSAPLIGSAGGTVSHASGAAVIVPPGGTQGDVTIRIAMDSTGAPPWSPTLTAAGDIYAVTPHGARFSAPAQVRLPIGPALLGLDGTLMMAKAQSGGSGWTLLNGAVREGDTLVAKVDSFSFFRVVVVPRPVTIAPFDVHAEAVSCTPGSVIPGGFGCLIDGGGSTMAARIQISGQALAGCDLRAPVALSVTAYPTRSSNPLTPAANAKIVLIDKQELTGQAATPLDLRPLPPRTITLNPTLVPWFGYENILLQVTTDCYDWQPGPFANSQPTLVAVSQQWRPLAMMFGAAQFAANALFANGRQYNPIAWVQQPDAPVGVEGQPLRLGAVLTGGASLGNLIDTTGSDPTWRPPSENDAATVDWERSEDGGVSWRPVSRSWEYDADPDPYHAGRPWRFWGTGTDLPSLTRQDAAALFRGRACYTIPGQSQVCHNSQGKRLTIAAAGGLPTLLSQPTSQLIRQGRRRASPWWRPGCRDRRCNGASSCRARAATSTCRARPRPRTRPHRRASSRTARATWSSPIPASPPPRARRSRSRSARSTWHRWSSPIRHRSRSSAAAMPCSPSSPAAPRRSATSGGRTALPSPARTARCCAWPASWRRRQVPTARP